ncbi:Transcription factor A, mitochondrial [Gigaspora margarita]|uniref:Transcription factor A, mitochondrial n=1 Tax=Gigaspora margarita TaxID=4874 RepID=A0A8H4B2X7_GIGMA|nr:Transcription factor A, mitochondrial [Gigaspora margarita]
MEKFVRLPTISLSPIRQSFRLPSLAGFSVVFLRQYAAAKNSTRTKTPKSTTTKPRTTKQKNVGTKKSTAKTRTKTKPVKPKDDNGPIPEGPKNPGTPYTMFYADFYNQFKPDNPTLKVTEIGKIAGERWRSMPNNERETYLEKYRNAKSKFEDEFKTWKESLTSKEIAKVNEHRKLAKSKGKHVKLLKDSRKPKRPKTPFIHFITANKNFDESKTLIEQTQELVERWKSMSPEEKKPFEDLYAQDKAVYDSQILVYKKSLE